MHSETSFESAKNDSTTTLKLPNSLSGKKGLVLGVANSNSIAYGAALGFHRAGAELMLTYGRPSTEQRVRPLLGELGAPDLLRCDARDDAQLEALFALLSIW